MPDSSGRLLKKAHLLRWPASALAAAYLQYASLGLWRAALHLGLFEQPARTRLIQQPARESRQDSSPGKNTKEEDARGVPLLDSVLRRKPGLFTKDT
jgi:hypothetical protein